MAHTYASNFIHCVFSTKERCPLIPPARTTELYAYLGGIARGEGLSLMAAGGTANHVHLLFALPASCALAHAVQKLKGSSSRWMGDGFSWQEGYGAFSVSPSQVRSSRDIFKTRKSITANAILSRNLSLSYAIAESNTTNGTYLGNWRASSLRDSVDFNWGETPR